MEENLLCIPDQVIDQLRCSQCKGHLSCGPVRLLPDGTSICGQCSPSNSDIVVYREILLEEAILKNVAFPCTHKTKGCGANVAFGRATEHGPKCAYQSYHCPLPVSEDEVCCWNGSPSELFGHLTKNHSSCLLETASLIIHVGENGQRVFAVLKGDFVLFVTYMYITSTRSFNYDVRYFSVDETISASYKINIENNETPDCSVSLKQQPCPIFDSSFNKINNMIDLSKYIDCLDNLQQVVRKSGINVKDTIINYPHQCMAYADDIILLARTQDELKTITRKLEAEARTVGLKFNEKKTKYMIMGREHRTTELLSTRTQEGKKLDFKKENTLTYLGTEFNRQGDLTNEIERRIIAASRCASAYRKTFSANSISWPVKVRLYKTVVRPVLCYGSETWVLRESDILKLEIWERKILRKIYGGIKENNYWRKRTNNELKELYKEPGIAKILRASRLKWLGHVERMGSERAPKKVLKREAEGRNKRGRPKNSWWECVKSDLDEINLTSWENKTKNRKIWNNIIKKAMGL